MFTKTTHKIKVTVAPHYLETQSIPEQDHFVWAYTIQLENMGDRTVQLLNRYWRITDAGGHVQEVRGPGVIGEQPTLRSGERFEYTSGASLHTPSGVMIGNYEMVAEDGEQFAIDIPLFSLDSPIQAQRPN